MPRKNTRRQTTSTMSSNSATSPTNVSLSDHKQSDESSSASSSASVSNATTDTLTQTNQKLDDLISMFSQFLKHQLQMGRSTGTIPPVTSVTPQTDTVLSVPLVTPNTVVSSATGLPAGVPNMTVQTNGPTSSGH